MATYSLEKLLGDNTTAVLVALLLFIVLGVTVLGLEVLNEGVNVLILFLILLNLRLGGSVLSGRLLLFLVEVTRLDLRVQRRGAVFGHCEKLSRGACRVGLVYSRERVRVSSQAQKGRRCDGVILLWVGEVRERARSRTSQRKKDALVGGREVAQRKKNGRLVCGWTNSSNVDFFRGENW